ncbi:MULTISPECIES: F0F1 ATP synthase subunit epsilon [unclassified Leucobacter]|uniref:F0F1 ATP synthase subunit epsilon n=1 Tax=unclassified Leucobacter TaxID=2621730 RepID=UPI00165D33DD|nr:MULTISPECIES: F0F1 ATP synthase subunit epsilon [unclassified Leucobacter]MBC9926102.1 F0F1 ATP synthase subunit epsilon [Leucobacter sp. cx-169]MBC9935758.1 F0F1 ATP synthase subunit epsilon [Leucobacter sp. cx-87]
MAELSVSVVSADREIWTGSATQIIATTVEGQIGILAGHQPMLAVLAQGEVRVTTTDGEKIVIDAEDGFLSVDHNAVQVVAGRAALVA